MRHKTTNDKVKFVERIFFKNRQMKLCHCRKIFKKNRINRDFDKEVYKLWRWFFDKNRCRKWFAKNVEKCRKNKKSCLNLNLTVCYYDYYK